MGQSDANDGDGLLKMLVRSVREYEDLIYFRKYSSEQEKKEIEQVIENLKRQIHGSAEDLQVPRAEESQKDEEVDEN